MSLLIRGDIIYLHKDDKGHVPDLVALLEDAEPLIAGMALTGLKGLTGQEMETPAEWAAWLRKQGAE